MPSLGATTMPNDRKRENTFGRVLTRSFIAPRLLYWHVARKHQRTQCTHAARYSINYCRLLARPHQAALTGKRTKCVKFVLALCDGQSRHSHHPTPTKQRKVVARPSARGPLRNVEHITPTYSRWAPHVTMLGSAASLMNGAISSLGVAFGACSRIN